MPSKLGICLEAITPIILIQMNDSPVFNYTFIYIIINYKSVISNTLNHILNEGIFSQ